MSNDRLSVLLAEVYEPSQHDEKILFLLTIATDLTVICRNGYRRVGDHNEVDPIVGMYCNELLNDVIGFINVMIRDPEGLEGSAPEHLVAASKLFGGTESLEHCLMYRLTQMAEAKGVEM